MPRIHHRAPLLLALAVATPALAADPFTNTPTTFNNNGGWSWFSDPRAIIANNQFIIGSIAGITANGSTAGDVNVTSVNLSTGLPTETLLHAALERDDHDVPAFSVLPDGRIFTIYQTHGANNNSLWRVSSTPGETTAWNPEQTAVVNTAADGNGNTYTNPFYLSTPNEVVNLSRAIGYDPNYSLFTNLSSTTPTFAYGGHWMYWKNPNTGPLTGGNGRPYLKYASNGSDTIWFATTEDSPQNYDNSLYAGYMQFTNTGAATLHTSTGASLGNISTATAPTGTANPPTSGNAGDLISGTGLSYLPTDFTPIVKANASFNGIDLTGKSVGWASSMQLDTTGNPHLGFVVIVDNLNGATKQHLGLGIFLRSSFRRRLASPPRRLRRPPALQQPEPIRRPPRRRPAQPQPHLFLRRRRPRHRRRPPRPRQQTTLANLRRQHHQQRRLLVLLPAHQHPLRQPPPRHRRQPRRQQKASLGYARHLHRLHQFQHRRRRPRHPHHRRLPDLELHQQFLLGHPNNSFNWSTDAAPSAFFNGNNITFPDGPAAPIHHHPQLYRHPRLRRRHLQHHQLHLLRNRHHRRRNIPHQIRHQHPHPHDGEHLLRRNHPLRRHPHRRQPPRPRHRPHHDPHQRHPPTPTQPPHRPHHPRHHLRQLPRQLVHDGPRPHQQQTHPQSTSKPTDLATLQSQINSAITSSTLPANYAIAVVDNAITHFTTFGNEPVTSNSILVSAELLGDTNLDGCVDLTDLSTRPQQLRHTNPQLDLRQLRQLLHHQPHRPLRHPQQLRPIQSRRHHFILHPSAFSLFEYPRTLPPSHRAPRRRPLPPSSRPQPRRIVPNLSPPKNLSHDFICIAP